MTLASRSLCEIAQLSATEGMVGRLEDPHLGQAQQQQQQQQNGDQPISQPATGEMPFFFVEATGRPTPSCQAEDGTSAISTRDQATSGINGKISALEKLTTPAGSHNVVRETYRQEKWQGVDSETRSKEIGDRLLAAFCTRRGHFYFRRSDE